MSGQTTCKFQQTGDLEASSPTLIEGLPGMGMVASIAVDQITEQLDLQRFGSIRSEAFPPAVVFEDGRVQEPVRVFGGEDPSVMTLQGSAVLPEEAYRPLSRCVLRDLVEEIGRAVFLVGAPAQSDEDRGRCTGSPRRRRSATISARRASNWPRGRGRLAARPGLS